MEQQPIEVFFSYSRADKPLRDKLEIHLSSLRQQGVISSWHDRQIVAGSEWEEEIDRHMRTADIILLLVSPDFVNSKYCYDIELPYAMRRHEAREAYVVPILLRPVARWKNLPFAKLQVYPSGGVPITQWADLDNGFVDVAEGIAIAVEKLLEERQEQERLNLEKIQQERDAWEAEEFFNQGLEKQNKGDYQAAIADYDQAIKLKPDYVDAFYNRGIAHRALGDKQAAIADYDQAIKLKPDYVNAFIHRGIAHRALGDKQAAIADYDQAIKLKPDYANVYCNRGVVRSELGDSQAAIADYNKSLEMKNPEPWLVYINRGVTRQALGDKQAAIADFDQAIKLQPDLATAFYNRGIARSELGDEQAAIADYDQAIKLQPDYANAFYNRGISCSELGDKNAAVADFQKAADCYQKQGSSYQDALNRIKELQQ